VGRSGKPSRIRSSLARGSVLTEYSITSMTILRGKVNLRSRSSVIARSKRHVCGTISPARGTTRCYPAVPRATVTERAAAPLCASAVSATPHPDQCPWPRDLRAEVRPTPAVCAAPTRQARAASCTRSRALLAAFGGACRESISARQARISCFLRNIVYILVSRPWNGSHQDRKAEVLGYTN
jgi:hypothetical protein